MLLDVGWSAIHDDFHQSFSGRTAQQCIIDSSMLRRMKECGDGPARVWQRRT